MSFTETGLSGSEFMGASGNTPLSPCFSGCAMEKPDCFPDDEKWEEYKRLWAYTVPKAPDSVDPCRDCIPSCRDEMTAKGLCAHPETVFIIFSPTYRKGDVAEPELIGVNGAVWSGWRDALLGKRGEVVSRCSDQELERMLAARPKRKKRESDAA